MTIEERALELLGMMSRMKTEEETEDGYVMEDAFQTLSELIASARQITGIVPDPEVNTNA